jgi:uncharacterized delta-60 repeat protein
MFSKLRRVLIALSIVAASSAAVKVAYAAEADGTVDLTYGSSGIASFEGAYRNTLALSDGKMVAFANVDVNSDYNPDKVEIKRFTSAGALDTNFGLNGTMTIEPSGHTYVQYQYSFADNAGGFYMVYSSNDPNPQPDNAGKMIRVTSAGVRDLNFGTGGEALLGSPAGGQQIGAEWIDASSGNIYTIQYGNVSAIGKQLSSGVPDTTFGTNNVSYIDWPYNGACKLFWRTGKMSLWVDPTESYALVAAFYDRQGSSRVLGVAKFDLSTRQCDTTYGTDFYSTNGSRTSDSNPDGFAEVDVIPGASSLEGSFHFQSDGSLIALVSDNSSVMKIAKVTPTGTLDSTFNTTGVSPDFWSELYGSYGSFPDVFVLSNGSIRIVGYPRSGTSYAKIVALTSGGSLDSSYGTNGVAGSPVCSNIGILNGAVRLPDGSIIANSVYSTAYPPVYSTYLVKLGAGGSATQCGTTTTTTQPSGGGGGGGGGGACTGGASISPSSTTGNGTVGQSMSLGGPVTSGYTGAVTFSVSGVPLPSGLTLNAQTGAVTGTPQSASYANVIINVVSGSQSCQYNIMFAITSGIGGGGGGGMPTCTTGAANISGTNPTLDPSFGTGGAIAFATTGVNNSLQGGVATSDGNIVVAESIEVSGNPVIKFRKYSPAGTLVSSFGTGGVLTVDKASGTSDEDAREIAELSDGSLIATYTVRTFAGMNMSTQNYLLKITSNGVIDTSFGTNGYVTFAISSTANILNLRALSDDSVVVLVSSYNQVMINELMKFTSSGAADSAFGTSGTLGLDESEYDFTVNSADSIFVGGSTSAMPSSATVKKYTSAGVLDTAWATSGVLTLSSVGNQGDDNSAQAVATDANNRIYVAVRAAPMQSNAETSKLLRLLADGTPDSSFGSGTLLSSASRPFVTEILVLADGNVILNSMNGGMTPSAGVSLVSSSGVLDSSHVTNTASLQFGTCALSQTNVVQLTTGEVMVFGSTYPMGMMSSNSTGSLWKLNFSGVAGGTGSTGGGSNTPSALPAPTLVTSANAAALVRAPGSESIIINGQEVVIESNNVNIPAARTPAAQRTAAQVASIQQAGAALLQQFLASLPAGATSTVTVVNTATGAVMQNLVFDANGNSVNVPVEDIVFLDGPQLSLMIGSNNANITADGKYQVGAGGIVGVTGSGLGVSATGEIIAMSTPTLLANFQTTAAGDFTKSATLPASIGVGDHTLVVATGTTYAMMGIRVVPAALPTTGTSSDRVVIIALFTLVFGALFFRGRRTFAL